MSQVSLTSTSQRNLKEIEDTQQWWSSVTSRLVIQALFRKQAPSGSDQDSIKITELTALLTDLGFTKKRRATLYPAKTKQVVETVGESMFTKEELRALALLIDEDQSGTIEFEEFYTWWVKMTQGGIDILLRSLKALTYAYLTFIKHDTDHSGYLDKTEMINVYNDLFQGEEEKDISLEELLEILDEDGDGKISFRELASTLGIV
ncbi:hypothetical protein ABK040_007809 [Willaertia magna]